MMIEKIFANTLGVLLENGNPGWLDQYGYMAKVQVRKNQTGETTFTDIAYPVARNVSADFEECDDPPYTNLAPDRRYRSLMIVEAIGDMAMTPNPQIPQRRGINFSQNIAVNVWVNLDKLALDPQNEGALAFDIIREWHGKKYKNVQMPITVGDTAISAMYINKMVVRLVSEKEHTPEAVFGKYSFAKDQGLFMNPYGYFGMIFNLSGLIISDCALSQEPAYESIAEC